MKHYSRLSPPTDLAGHNGHFLRVFSPTGSAPPPGHSRLSPEHGSSLYLFHPPARTGRTVGYSSPLDRRFSCSSLGLGHRRVIHLRSVALASPQSVLGSGTYWILLCVLRTLHYVSWTPTNFHCKIPPTRPNQLAVVPS